jgi:hypothetical protein
MSYVTAVIKRSLEANPDGWRESDDQLVIEWMLLPPAPEDVL